MKIKVTSERERERGHSRLAFFNVRVFVTAGEGEELIVDIVGRHCDGNRTKFRGVFERMQATMEAKPMSLRIWRSRLVRGLGAKEEERGTWEVQEVGETLAALGPLRVWKWVLA